MTTKVNIKKSGITVDGKLRGSVCASYQAVPGSILGIPEIILMLLRFIVSNTAWRERERECEREREREREWTVQKG